MADSSVAVTAGSGTSIDTRTEATNGNHRQVIVIGDPSTNAGVAPVDATAGLKVDLGADNDVVLGAGTNGIGKLTANDGVDIGDVTVNGGSLSITSVTPGTNNTSLGKTEDAGHSTGDVGVMSLGVANTADANISGTTLDYTPFSTDLTGAVRTIGNADHDAADAGKPVKIGAKAETSLSGLTLVADGDRTDLFAGIDGVLITRPHCNLEDIVTGNASNTDGSSTSCIASSGAGVKTYLTSVILTNTSSSNIYVEIKDGATAKLTIPVPANGGAIFTPQVPIPGTAATAWNFDASAATTTVYCSMVGFKSKV
jgi:hypothetical protein